MAQIAWNGDASRLEGGARTAELTTPTPGRTVVLGQPVGEEQRITVHAGAGTFTVLSPDHGNAPIAITLDGPVADVQAQLEAIYGAGVTVTLRDGVYIVLFGGHPAGQDVAQLALGSLGTLTPETGVPRSPAVALPPRGPGPATVPPPFNP